MRCVGRNFADCSTTAETSFTTSLQKIEIMELKGYSRPTCNRLCATSHDAVDVVRVIHKLDRRRSSFVDDTID